MYAHICTRPYLTFPVSVLGRFLSNLEREHWVDTKKVMRYLHRTKGHMLIFMKVDNLEVVDYTHSYFAGCYDDMKYTS